MIPEGMLPHLVDVTHPGTTTDRYDNEVDDWSPGAATHAEVAAWLQQSSGDEDNDQRSAQIAEWVLICNPEDTAGNALIVHGQDRVTWQALTFEVIGPPGPAYTPDELHHYEIRLRYVKG